MRSLNFYNGFIPNFYPLIKVVLLLSCHFCLLMGKLMADRWLLMAVAVAGGWPGGG
jgi:hypothetical protein